ncbi:Gfo/Idh/MocA family protein [Stratiformator vulcanicus]|uniref:1,5-anhydro-D-fructose reductase n=1 Tax=Stratiformator vulcanicus TaxID=2527980 RepID=A0A517R3L1_9PLAN|nr:Gfo/Idh/MocA family oxidoreductase [Stratiformator vulcanicus]QDT38423.1 1,5-anhydro-D-fructose reductase [Stratiformator vulcanicus]
MPQGFAIVGCGMIAEFHAAAIAELRGAKLVACMSSRKASADKFAEKHGCKSYTSLSEMLDDPEVTIVNICTPSGAHMEPALAAAKAGKHVVVEKPLEITLKRCDKIIDACEAAGVRLCTIFPSRFGGANQELKKAVESGRFGRLTLGDTFVKWWRSQEYYDSGGWRGTWELDGGGAYMNQAIHNVDLIYWMMGDVAEVSAVTATLAHERIEVEDVGVAALKFANGAVGTITATTSAFPGLLKKTEIHGTEGSAIVEQDEILMWDFAKKDRRDASIKKKFGGAGETSGGAADPKAISHQGHMLQLKDFVKSIETGSEPVVDGREGRKSVEIILAIYQSSWTGKRVSLPLKRDPKRPA